MFSSCSLCRSEERGAGRYDVYGGHSLLQARLVGGLPDLGKCHSAVETMEDAQGQCDALNDGPGYKAVELQLHLFGGKEVA